MPTAVPIFALSPSHYSGLLECPLREAWSANGEPPALAANPAARLGSIAHRLLEEAGHGEFANAPPQRMAQRWTELVHAAEQAMAASWLERHLVPLQQSVPQFEVRRIQALHRAAAVSAGAAGPCRGEPVVQADPPTGFEVAVRTPDGRARGKIDAVLPGRAGVTIRDYKSGGVRQQPGTRHPPGGAGQAYTTQLKLYAAIYASMTGEWPARLEILPLAGGPETVSFTAAECPELLAAALAQLDRVNATIVGAPSGPDAARQLAHPSPDNCAHCPYRPVCEPYRAAAAEAPGEPAWPPDAWGRLVEVVSLGNRRLVLILAGEHGPIRIRDIDPDPARHPALLGGAVGDQVAGFTLLARPGACFLQSRGTVIYRQATR